MDIVDRPIPLPEEQNINTCMYVIKRGNFKGQYCNFARINNYYCRIHCYNLPIVPGDSKT